MNKIKKDLTPGDLVIHRSKLPGMLISKLHDAVSAWEAGRSEELAALTNKIMDLGVAWEQLQVASDVDSVMLFPGVGAHITQETDLGNVLIGLKTAVEQRNIESFKAAAEGITNIFAGIEQTTEAAALEENSEEETSEEKKQPSEQPEQPIESGSVETPNTEAPATSTLPVESGNSETVEQAKDEVEWGLDLAGEHQVNKQRIEKAEKEKAELKRREKAASIQPESFSWDKVLYGEYKPD